MKNLQKNRNLVGKYYSLVLLGLLAMAIAGCDRAQNDVPVVPKIDSPVKSDSRSTGYGQSVDKANLAGKELEERDKKMKEQADHFFDD